MQIIKTYTNSETEMASVVMESTKGWHVQLKDLESEEWLPFVRIFPFDKFTVEAAKDHARFLVYGARTQEDTPSLEPPWYAHK